MVDVLLSEHVVREGVLDLPYSDSFGFSGSHRLLRRNGFDHVVRAEAVLNEYFKVFFVKNELTHARLGIVASKRVLPGAVQRNFIKRSVREIFRHHIIKNSALDLVVMVRSVHAPQSNGQNQSLNMLLHRVQKRCVTP